MTADRWASIHSEFARARRLILEGRGSLHELCEGVSGMGAAAKQWAEEQAVYAEKKRRYEARLATRNAERKKKEQKELLKVSSLRLSVSLGVSLSLGLRLCSSFS